MKFLDYVFYRMYDYYVRKKDSLPPVFGASLIIALNICSYTWIIWVPFLRYFFPHIGMLAYDIHMVVIIILCWMWYRKRVIIIIDKYKRRKFKSKIPLWTIMIFTCLSPIIGAIINIYFRKYLDSKGIFLP